MKLYHCAQIIRKTLFGDILQFLWLFPKKEKVIIFTSDKSRHFEKLKVKIYGDAKDVSIRMIPGLAEFEFFSRTRNTVPPGVGSIYRDPITQKLDIQNDRLFVNKNKYR